MLLELPLKREFQALAGGGFEMFLALIVSLEYARNSVAAENMCKLLKGKEGSLFCGSFTRAEMWSTCSVLTRPSKFHEKTWTRGDCILASFLAFSLASLHMLSTCQRASVAAQFM